MLKKLIAFGCFCLLVTMFQVDSISAALPAITVVLDGEALVFDVSPRNIDGRIMVPMRTIFETLGADVEWDDETGTITASKDGVYVISVVGDPSMKVGSNTIIMDIAPMIVEGRTLVPIRFVAEAFGIDIDWDEARHEVYISTMDAIYDSAIPQLPSSDTAKEVGENQENPTQTDIRPRQEPVILHRGRLMVMYHANGGVGAPISNTRTIEEDSSVRFRHPLSEPRKEGYAFIGWLFENDMNFGIEEPGGRVLVLDLDPNENEFITYFAQWERA